MTQMTPEERDSVSKKIGDFLVQGYRLLEESCDKCLTPKMSPRNGSPFCVFCGKSVPLRQPNLANPSSDEKKTAKTSVTTRMDASNSDKCQNTTEVALQAKLAWASSRLNDTSNLEECLQLANLIKTLLASLKIHAEITTKTS